jgi:enamine deaminase RidA (YjgF/YER057c/UK114 family)
MSDARQTIQIASLKHVAPIPSASRKGPLLISSAISGADPSSGELPVADVAQQVANVFANIQAILEEAGATSGDIVKLTFFVVDRSAKDHINDHWVALFPSESDRPARHTMVANLPPNTLVQCELIAFCE